MATILPSPQVKVALAVGALAKGCVRMQVLHIKPVENVALDQDRLGLLYAELGATSAEDVVCRALEELALRLTHCDSLFGQARWDDLRRNVRALGAIAEQIGMSAAARVARDVVTCLDRNDEIALAATLSRLLRVGGRSLSFVWNMPELEF